MSLLLFLLFALVASITPGPTNVLILGHGARASLPLVLGSSLGAVALVLVVGFALGQTLARHPDWQRGLKSTQAWRGFNLGMAALLLVSAWATMV